MSFATRPAEGWTVLMLNAYEVSVMQDKGLEGYQEAARLMREYNPNDVLNSQGQVRRGHPSPFTPNPSPLTLLTMIHAPHASRPMPLRSTTLKD